MLCFDVKSMFEVSPAIYRDQEQPNPENVFRKSLERGLDPPSPDPPREFQNTKTCL